MPDKLKMVPIGTGVFLPERVVGNVELLAYLQPVFKGKPVTPQWIETRLGILSRRNASFDYQLGKRLTVDEGALFDTDMAVLAAKAALQDAGLEADDMDLVYHVSCTPDFLHCEENQRALRFALELRPNVETVHRNLGCAGLAPAFRSIAAFLYSGMAKRVLLVASNSMSANLVKERYQRSGYQAICPADGQTEDPHQNACLSPILFGDGAAAVVFEARVNGDCGVAAIGLETYPERKLITYTGGGSRFAPETAADLWDMVYDMDPMAVKEAFNDLIPRFIVKAQTDTGVDLDEISRFYFHQANGLLVREFCRTLGIPEEKAPLNVTTYGNLVSASTLALFHEDRKSGAIKHGDKLLFLWIGAGSGAMAGYALMNY